MAKVDNKGNVRGTAGSMVYRGYRGKTIIQSKPRKFNQTSESIKASTEFGLSSTTAAVIRQAFQPSYVHRDGEAVSRSTQIVYRSIRGSLNHIVGKRDLHDADLSCLKGMEFNVNSKISEVLQTSLRVQKDEDDRISVVLGSLNARTDLRIPNSIRQASSRYRIRLTLIGFNFRQEYYEFLEVKDLDMRAAEILEEQKLVFDVKAAPDQLLMLSMSLLAYRDTPMEEGSVLLNSKEFSPCAIIAAYAAAEPGEYPEGPVNMELTKEQESRQAAINMMCYDGNRLLRELTRRVRSTRSKAKLPAFPEDPPMKTGHRISFKKK